MKSNGNFGSSFIPKSLKTYFSANMQLLEIIKEWLSWQYEKDFIGLTQNHEKYSSLFSFHKVGAHLGVLMYRDTDIFFT